MGRLEVHAAAAAQRSAEEHPLAAEAAAIPAADIRAAAPEEIAEAIPVVAEVLAEVEAADIPVEEAARPAAEVVAEEEDILVAAVVEAEEVPEAVAGTATRRGLLKTSQREPVEEVERLVMRRCSHARWT